MGRKKEGQWLRTVHKNHKKVRTRRTEQQKEEKKKEKKKKIEEDQATVGDGEETR